MGRPKKSAIRGRRPPLRQADVGVFSSGRSTWGTRWRVIAGTEPQLDAAALVDHVSDVVLSEHHEAIRSGRRADGSGLQPKLNPRGTQGRRAEEGQRPNVRGYTGLTVKPFSDEIRRTAIKVKAGPTLRRTTVKLGLRLRTKSPTVRAKTTIEPAPIHRGWLGTEAGRGVEYFYVGGLVEHMVDLAVSQWLDVGIEGALKAADRRDRRARNARSR